MEAIRQGKNKMRRKIVVVAFWMVGLLVCMTGAALASEAQEAHRGNGEDIDKWAQDIYPQALDKLLPAGVFPLGEFPPNARWVATVRILPPQAEEYWFQLVKNYDGKVQVLVKLPNGKPITSQLRTLRNKNPNAPVDKILALVDLKRRSVTGATCPDLDKLSPQFEAIAFSPVLPDELFIHDTGYEFWSESPYGNRSYVVLAGPGRSAKRQSHPLLKWAEEVRYTLEASCK